MSSEDDNARKVDAGRSDEARVDTHFAGTGAGCFFKCPSAICLRMQRVRLVFFVFNEGRPGLLLRQSYC
jgi:hypothetical protein